MLLLLRLSLGGAIMIATPTVPTPIPSPIQAFGGGGGGTARYSNVNDDIAKRNIEQRKKTEIEDSEIIAIIGFTLKNFII